MRMRAPCNPRECAGERPYLADVRSTPDSAGRSDGSTNATMKITAIETHVIVAPDLRQDRTSGSQDDIVVLVHTDEGITGIGETDTGPWLAKAAIESPGSHTM